MKPDPLFTDAKKLLEGITDKLGELTSPLKLLLQRAGSIKENDRMLFIDSSSIKAKIEDGTNVIPDKIHSLSEINIGGGNFKEVSTMGNVTITGGKLEEAKGLNIEVCHGNIAQVNGYEKVIIRGGNIGEIESNQVIMDRGQVENIRAKLVTINGGTVHYNINGYSDVKINGGQVKGNLSSNYNVTMTGGEVTGKVSINSQRKNCHLE